MNIGDKVRFLHGKESGVITKKLDRGLVEVEIEDGFSIPVLATELVVVSQDESSAFDGSATNTVASNPKTARKDDSSRTSSSLKEGYYIAVIPLNDKLHSIYMLSALNVDSLLMVNETNSKSEERTILSEKLFANSFSKITERNLDQLNTWPGFTITILQESNRWAIANKPEKISLQIKSKHFQKGKANIPIINKLGYLIPLQSVKSETVAPTYIDAEALKDKMFESQTEDFSKEGRNNMPAENEVDLHIEALRKDFDQIPKDQILLIQMQAFEQKLNQAIMSGQDEIVFIHGVGNGTLKNRIHKYLSKSDHIKFFKDAHKEKFGYGATLIRIN